MGHYILDRRNYLGVFQSNTIRVNLSGRYGRKRSCGGGPRNYRVYRRATAAQASFEPCRTEKYVYLKIEFYVTSLQIKAIQVNFQYYIIWAYS